MPVHLLDDGEELDSIAQFRRILDVALGHISDAPGFDLPGIEPGSIRQRRQECCFMRRIEAVHVQGGLVSGMPPEHARTSSKSAFSRSIFVRM